MRHWTIAAAFIICAAVSAGVFHSNALPPSMVGQISAR